MSFSLPLLNPIRFLEVITVAVPTQNLFPAKSLDVTGNKTEPNTLTRDYPATDQPLGVGPAKQKFLKELFPKNSCLGFGEATKPRF